jgi:hypothetical protein
MGQNSKKLKLENLKEIQYSLCSYPTIKTHYINTKSVFVPIVIYIGTLKATPIANQPNNLMGRQNTIHCTQSEPQNYIIRKKL